MDVVAFYQAMIAPPAPWRVSLVEVDTGGQRVDVWLEHGRGERFPCPDCGISLPVYDHTPERAWRHLDTCEYQTWLHARLPRVDCPQDGTKQAKAPLAEGSSRFTARMECRCVDTLRECSRSGAASLSGLSWDEMDGIMERAVERGMERRGPEMPKQLGIDEKAMFKRHKYTTVVTDLAAGTVFDVIDRRSVAAIEPWFEERKEALKEVDAVAMDMSAAYAAITAKYMGQADLCFDHFHVSALAGRSVDEVRKAEQKQFEDKAERTAFFRSRYLFLYNEENIPEDRRERFDELRTVAVKTGRAWAIKENLRGLWQCETLDGAATFFKKWYWWATHSRLEPVRKMAHTLKNHWDGIANAIVRRITNACTEGLNSKIEKVKRDAFGFRNKNRMRIAILFHCGGLDMYPQIP